jgi:hypothetical protein
MFPGGKDVLFDALRVRELEEFFARLNTRLDGAQGLEDLLVRTVVAATDELRHDDHLALMLASAPGETLSQLTVDGLPRIIPDGITPPRADGRAAPRPRARGAPRRAARPLVISYFLAPVRPRRPRRRPTPHRRSSDPTSSRPSSRSSPTQEPPMTIIREPRPTTDDHSEHHRPRRDQRHRRDPRDPAHRPDEILHIVKDNADRIFTWDYSRTRPALSKLYEKAKTGQWNATTDLPWATEVDVERVVAADQAILGTGIDRRCTTARRCRSGATRSGSSSASRPQLEPQPVPPRRAGRADLHRQDRRDGPWYEAKLYASTQVVDEARHVEVFARYLSEKLGGEFAISPHLRMLLDDIIDDSRWDMTYLGMQVMVEGLALAAFGFLHQTTTEPLLKQLLRYVMSDEARHVAFGVLSLKECYDGMSDAEMKDRQEFAFEAAIRMRDRFMQQEVWERMGVKVRDVLPIVLQDPTRGCSSRCCSARSSRTARSSACSTATTSGFVGASRRWA